MIRRTIASPIHGHFGHELGDFKKVGSGFLDSREIDSYRLLDVPPAEEDRCDRDGGGHPADQRDQGNAD
jgi:hypothetical protein